MTICTQVIPCTSVYGFDKIVYFPKFDTIIFLSYLKLCDLHINYRLQQLRYATD